MTNVFGRFFQTNSKEDEPEVTDDKRITGKVFKTSGKGWGFIISEEMPFERIFFHWTELNPGFKFPNLRKGMKVEFTPIEMEGKGYKAVKINVLSEE